MVTTTTITIELLVQYSYHSREVDTYRTPNYKHYDFIFYRILRNVIISDRMLSNVMQSALILHTITGFYVFHVSGSPPTYSRVREKRVESILQDTTFDTIVRRSGRGERGVSLFE